MRVDDECFVAYGDAMSPPNGEDRSAILARRAFFVSSAMSAISCSPAADTATPGVSGTPTQMPSATSSASAISSAKPPSDVPFQEAMVDAPPRGASKDLPDGIREEAEELEKRLATTYDAVAKVWGLKVDLCDAAQPNCKDAWRALGDGFQTARDAVRDLVGRPCGQWYGTLGTLSKRRNAHQLFLTQKLDELEERYAALALSMSPQGEQVWRGIAANTKVPPPMPCLKCMPPKRQLDDTDFTFAEGSSTLDAKGLEEIAELAKQSTEQAIEIVAHADASEPKPEELAKARAEAVAAALKAKGVKATRLKVIALGANLPLSNDKAQNRRVETALLYER